MLVDIIRVIGAAALGLCVMGVFFSFIFGIISIIQNYGFAYIFILILFLWLIGCCLYLAYMIGDILIG